MRKAGPQLLALPYLWLLRSISQFLLLIQGQQRDTRGISPGCYINKTGNFVSSGRRRIHQRFMRCMVVIPEQGEHLL